MSERVKYKKVLSLGGEEVMGSVSEPYKYMLKVAGILHQNKTLLGEYILNDEIQSSWANLKNPQVWRFNQSSPPHCEDTGGLVVGLWMCHSSAKAIWGSHVQCAVWLFQQKPNISCCMLLHTSGQFPPPACHCCCVSLFLSFSVSLAHAHTVALSLSLMAAFPSTYETLMAERSD